MPVKLYPAPLIRRVGAFVIDYMTLLFASLFISAALLGIFDWPQWISQTITVLIVLFIIFYAPICEALFHGQTLGKKAVGIRVLRTNGQPVSATHALQRLLMSPFDLYLTMGIGGLAAATVTEKSQRIGDILADTMVVYANPNHWRISGVYDIDHLSLSRRETEIFNQVAFYANQYEIATPLELAQMYRAIECCIATLRTHKGDPNLIKYAEHTLSTVHMALFKKKWHSAGDVLLSALRSIPQAILRARKAIFASIAICLIAYAIGFYSQDVDPEFFKKIYGYYYTSVTEDNIAAGNPLGIYQSEGEWEMFWSIFFNNLMVSLRVYAMGIFVFIGPLAMLINNFISFGIFDMFFAQHGLLADALIVCNEHGTLELFSIMMTGGASFHLCSGLLFPGKLPRLKAWARSARESLLILISTIPMLFVAAFIEGFVTRHVEWPLYVKLSIIAASAIFIIAYYVVLPILAHRD